MKTSLSNSLRPAGPCRGSVVLLSLYSKSGTPARVTGIIGEFAGGSITDGMVASAPLGLSEEAYQPETYWLLLDAHNLALAWNDGSSWFTLAFFSSEAAMAYRSSWKAVKAIEMKFEHILRTHRPEECRKKGVAGLYFPEDGSKVYL